MKQFVDRNQYNVHRYDDSRGSKHQQSDHCDGISTLFAEENREGVMEHQEKHQNYSDYATVDYTLRS
uniref:Uncharacterized protein n=1 Tax=Arundo donax TaxID=35708 RepID=A0A0A9HTJ4_ARUDO